MNRHSIRLTISAPLLLALMLALLNSGVLTRAVLILSSGAGLGSTRFQLSPNTVPSLLQLSSDSNQTVTYFVCWLWHCSQTFISVTLNKWSADAVPMHD